MTEKQLHKLSREDLLKLLLEQSQEISKQKEAAAALAEKGQLAEASVERLKQKLDEKDAQLERLKQKLNEKDSVIERLGGVPEALPDEEGRAPRGDWEAECRALRQKTRDQEELIGHLSQFLKEKDRQLEQLKKRVPSGTEPVDPSVLPTRLAFFLQETAAMLERFQTQIGEKEERLSALQYKNNGED